MQTITLTSIGFRIAQKVRKEIKSEFRRLATIQRKTKALRILSAELAKIDKRYEESRAECYSLRDEISEMRDELTAYKMAEVVSPEHLEHFKAMLKESNAEIEQAQQVEVEQEVEIFEFWF